MQKVKKIRGWKNFEVALALYDLEMALAKNTNDMDMAKASFMAFVKKHLTLNIKK